MVGIVLSLSSPSRRRIALRDRSGSIIELPCVITIMSILAAASWSSIVGIVTGNRLSNSAYNLRGLMLQARADAMTQNTYVWLGFYTTTKNGETSLMVSSVAARSGLVTDLKGGNYQMIRKPVPPGM